MRKAPATCAGASFHLVREGGLEPQRYPAEMQPDQL